MRDDEKDATIEKLVREHNDVMEQRLQVIGHVRQIATALKRIADAIYRRPDFDAVVKDSILHEYLDLSKIGALVLQEKDLSAKQEDYENRLRALGW